MAYRFSRESRYVSDSVLCVVFRNSRYSEGYYKGIRVFDSETNRPDNYDPYWLKSFAVVNTMEFDTIKSWIDRAVEEQSWVIIMLHGISEDRLEEYETTPEIL